MAGLSADDWRDEYGPSVQTGETSFWGDGLHTGVRLGNDGRLDIEIAQHRPSIASLLAHLHPETEAGIPTERAESEQAETPRLSRLNIVMHVVGSRGDVQPFIALGEELQRVGHRVRLATHLAFRDFVLEHGLEFFDIGGDPAEMMAFMVRNPGLVPDLSTLRSGAIPKRRRDIATILDGCWRSCFETGDGTHLHQIRDDLFDEDGIDGIAVKTADYRSRPFVADAIIANPPSFAHLHIAEKLGIPLTMIFTMPWSPTQAFPHPLANIRRNNAKPSVANFASYAVVEMMLWEGLGDIINKFRRGIGLDTLDAVRAPSLVHQLKVPYIYMWSPSLLPKPADWADHIRLSGFIFLPADTDYAPPEELVSFLEAGSPPLYIGFGSIVVSDPIALTKTVFEAVQCTGHRAIVSAGWSRLAADQGLEIPSSIYLLQGNCPHDWLFPRVSAVVHHGGAGTTATGLACGCPTVVVPFFGDQPFWGSIVARAGAGPTPIPFKQLTADRLAESIQQALTPEIRERARQLSEQMRGENGVQSTVAAFHEHLFCPIAKNNTFTTNNTHDGIRSCALSPGRPASYRLMPAGIPLSAFAASVLIDRGIVKAGSSHLQPYRPAEYDTSRDPAGPISAGAGVFLGATARFITGLADMPFELVGITQQYHQNHQCHRRKRSAPDENSRHSVDSSSSYSSSSSSSSSSALSISTDISTTSEPSLPVTKATKKSRIPRWSKQMLDVLIVPPMDVTLTLSRGFHNMPRLYHDRTVKPTPKVTDVRTGLQAAGSEFTQGFVQGIGGLVSHPRMGWEDHGTAGFVKGVGKGVAGVIFKPPAGLWGLAGYPLKGLHKSLRHSLFAEADQAVHDARMALGQDEMHRATAKECDEVIRKWNLINRDG
ncbi:hypothetical protein ASPZODRAFT_98895 [Penicilliopsis zonata CBS 506.65]|uniref:Uncharacterized protein n=1 Tax=Penicilliopsis zonata CBS 506.65 TaxID=1073090 RepID=A0A1L9SFM4_9EURO|nr:hypothetical protein ASPZODRAFT_98895 [Penicilliopsis zonata CBS 506.65]OJJ45897.1 hypothetical protein ASPZODRAFT_98895 [Penicilliopsis zonata CBS 506.65]